MNLLRLVIATAAEIFVLLAITIGPILGRFIFGFSVVDQWLAR